jgi:hypothetical protein
VTTEAITIDATDFDKAAAALSAAGFEEVAEKHIKHALRVSANVVRNNVRSEASRHRRTGKLERDVHTTWKGAGMASQLRVSATGPVAHLIVGGVRPHRIEPGHPMHVGGLIGWRNVVEARGFRGDPFVHKGITDSLPAIQRIVTQAGADMAAELAARMEG